MKKKKKKTKHFEQCEGHAFCPLCHLGVAYFQKRPCLDVSHKHAFCSHCYLGVVSFQKRMQRAMFGCLRASSYVFFIISRGEGGLAVGLEKNDMQKLRQMKRIHTYIHTYIHIYIYIYITSIIHMKFAHV